MLSGCEVNQGVGTERCSAVVPGEKRSHWDEQDKAGKRALRCGASWVLKSGAVLRFFGSKRVSGAGKPKEKEPGPQAGGSGPCWRLRGGSEG